MLRALPRLSLSRVVPRATLARGYAGKGFPAMDEEPNPTASQEGVRADQDGDRSIDELQRETIYEVEHKSKGAHAEQAAQNPQQTDSEEAVRAEQGKSNLKG